MDSIAQLPNAAKSCWLRIADEIIMPLVSLYACFVNEQNGDAIADWICTLAFWTLQRFPLFS